MNYKEAIKSGRLVDKSPKRPWRERFLQWRMNRRARKRGNG